MPREITVPAPVRRQRATSTTPATVRVDVPFVASTKYAQREISLTLTPDEGTVLRSIFDGLQEQHAKLTGVRKAPGGRPLYERPIRSPQDAIKWWLETVAREASPAPHVPLNTTR